MPPGLADRVRPVSSTADRLVPVLPPLAALLPDGALRRGTSVVVAGRSGQGASTLALALLAGATGHGHWAAAVGLADPGVAAMAELGIDLGRLALVPRPRAGWADAVATLLDGVDVVLVRPPGRPRPTATRHLVARVRERQGVLVVLVERAEHWPEGPDVTLTPRSPGWSGLAEGHLRQRPAEVVAAGRRAGVPTCHRLWLPSATGTVAAREPGPAPAGGG